MWDANRKGAQDVSMYSHRTDDRDAWVAEPRRGDKRRGEWAAWSAQDVMALMVLQELQGAQLSTDGRERQVLPGQKAWPVPRDEQA